jgi:hypothetical protein
VKDVMEMGCRGLQCVQWQDSLIMIRYFIYQGHHWNCHNLFNNKFIVRHNEGDGCEQNFALNGYFRLLKWLCVVILQDAAVLIINDINHEVIFTQSIFTSHEFLYSPHKCNMYCRHKVTHYISKLREYYQNFVGK